MIPESEKKSWTRRVGDTEFFCSNDPALIQLDALNTALGSEMMWWAKALPEDQLRQMVDNSMCLALYTVQNTDPEAERAMIGFARIITDYTTFGYLTDVYVLREHQGKGLGRWLMDCLDEVISGWPELRRFVIVTREADAVRLYQNALGARDIRETSLSSVFFLERFGSGAKKVPSA